MSIQKDLVQLAVLVARRNDIARQISRLIGRPAAVRHVGEYIASRVFAIALAPTSNQKAFDGRFFRGPLKGHTVNIKWYLSHERALTIVPDAMPDYFLVLTGSMARTATSRGSVRPWTVQHVFLFDSRELLRELKRRRVRIGIASSIAQRRWAQAEIYPASSSRLLQLTSAQRQALALFNARRRH